MATATVDLIKRVPLFSDLDPRELKTLAATFKERTFPEGQEVAAEGRGGAGFFLIEHGRATVTVRGEERGRLGPGDYFGEIALIDEGARTATVTAETELRCYALTFWEFRPLLESEPSVTWKLLQAVAKMLRTAEQREP